MSVEAPPAPNVMPAPIPEVAMPPAVLPYGEIPLERGMISEGLLHVAGHELNHALVAQALGVDIAGISVVPQGNSLGRTILAGYASPEVMKVIAAAGSVSTHDGTSKGFGSDLHTAGLLKDYFGGISVEAAQQLAADLIAKYPEDVRRKAAEIIAFQRAIASPDIARLMERAQFEVMMEEEGYEMPQSWTDLRREDHEEETREYTVIDDLRGGDSRIRYYEGKKLVKEETICDTCLGVNGHFDGCAKFEAPKEEHSFPEFGRIYTREELKKNPINDHELLAA